MFKKSLILSFLAILIFCFCLGLFKTQASDLTGDLSSGIGGGSGGMDGVVKAAPTASPAAGTYHATQSVALSASGSTAICYTTNGTAPACSTATTCATGSLYSSAVSIDSAKTLKSAACYADDSTGPVAIDAFSFTCATASVSHGTVSSYSDCDITCDSGYTLSGSSCVASSSGGGGGGGGGGDISAPSISQIAETTGDTTATITWTTNEGSISWVVYGLTAAYGTEQKTTDYKTSHSIVLTGLSTGTTYHYQIKAKDSTGNISSYTDKTFTTTGAPTVTIQSTPTNPGTPISSTASTTATSTGALAPVSVTNSIGYSLMRKTGSNDVWVVQNGLKLPVRSIDVFNGSGYGSAVVKTVSASSFNNVPSAALIKTDDSPDVYFLENNFRRKLASIEIFNGYKLNWNKISIISQQVMNSFSYAPIYKHGVDIYWRDSNNAMHKFPTMTIFTARGYDVRDLITINDLEFTSFSVGEPITN